MRVGCEASDNRAKNFDETGRGRRSQRFQLSLILHPPLRIALQSCSTGLQLDSAAYPAVFDPDGAFLVELDWNQGSEL